MFNPDQYAQDALRAGCPPDQYANFVRAGIILQPRQLAASAAARLCDHPDGPSAIGYGGARGGGKSHWLLAQMGADDCQRRTGLKCLLLRKDGKSNNENFQDLRRRIFPALKHTFNASTGTLVFANGSRIIARHYQHEKEINALLGIEYDVIGIEEATTLTECKYQDLLTCLRTSRTDWRPRHYSTTNPGGVGHEWYRQTFVVPFERGAESATRFLPARVDDNRFNNPEYKNILTGCTGWKKEAWLHGNWNIASGQFFRTFRYSDHVVSQVDPNNIVEWIAGMDYGYTHYTVVLLGGRDAVGNLFIVDEFVARNAIPQQLVLGIKEMCQRNRLFVGNPNGPHLGEMMKIRRRFDPPYSWRIRQISAGTDLFSTQFDGSSLAGHFASLGIPIRPANTHRAQGWAEIQQRLGDVAAGFPPTLFIHQRCHHLIDCLPFLQHDPNQPADVLKTDVNEEGLGGDDAADALRYLVATRIPWSGTVKLRGF